MEPIRDYLINQFGNQPDCRGLLLVDGSCIMLGSDLDLMLLVIRKNDGSALTTKHVIINGKRILIRSVVWASLQQQLVKGENRDLIQWLVRGEILLDQEGLFGQLRERSVLNAGLTRERRLLEAFANFLKEYLLSKEHLHNREILDAHSHIVAALHHWAQIILVESGEEPASSIWVQLRTAHPGIYKLYEELAASPETLKQRVELALLASEFSVMSKMKECCALLLNILGSRTEPWSLEELYMHPKLEGMGPDLIIVLQKLVKRFFIKEVAVITDFGGVDAMELKYQKAVQ